MRRLVESDWTLFLDRDGVINERIMGGYVTKPEEFHFLEKVPESIQIFREVFNRIIVVTNQQCIAKNVLTERNLFELHRYFQNELMKNNTHIDAVYFAPELATDPNSTRKPKPFMALAAQIDYPEIDFSKSVMVGDTDSDIYFGRNLGMKTVRIKTVEPIGVEADFIYSSLHEFALTLKKENK